MMLNLLLLYGGKSGEHEISLISAAHILRNLSPEKYTVYPVWISHEGKWRYLDEKTARQHSKVKLPPGKQECFIRPGQNNEPILVIEKSSEIPLDFCFPGLHGTFGEDGKMQGLLESLHLPYGGSGVKSSALSMDKIATRHLMAALGIGQVKYLALTDYERNADPSGVVRNIESNLPYPVFVKPANLGSSVGVSRVKTRGDLELALDTAFAYDTSVIIEEGKKIRELEMAILGNSGSEAVSEVGEVIVHREFYDYEAKYLDEDAAEISIPAKISDEVSQKAREIAGKAYRALGCSGYARADIFFCEAEKALYFNEINTLPGFTPASMFPRLWLQAGIQGPDLMDRIVQAGLEMHRAAAKLKYRFKD